MGGEFENFAWLLAARKIARRGRSQQAELAELPHAGLEVQHVQHAELAELAELPHAELEVQHVQHADLAELAELPHAELGDLPSLASAGQPELNPCLSPGPMS